MIIQMKSVKIAPVRIGRRTFFVKSPQDSLIELGIEPTASNIAKAEKATSVLLLMFPSYRRLNRRRLNRRRAAKCRMRMLNRRKS